MMTILLSACAYIVIIYLAARFGKFSKDCDEQINEMKGGKDEL